MQRYKLLEATSGYEMQCLMDQHVADRWEPWGHLVVVAIPGSVPGSRHHWPATVVLYQWVCRYEEEPVRTTTGMAWEKAAPGALEPACTCIGLDPHHPDPDCRAHGHPVVAAAPLVRWTFAEPPRLED